MVIRIAIPDADEKQLTLAIVSRVEIGASSVGINYPCASVSS